MMRPAPSSRSPSRSIACVESLPTRIRQDQQIAKRSSRASSWLHVSLASVCAGKHSLKCLALLGDEVIPVLLEHVVMIGEAVVVIIARHIHLTLRSLRRRAGQGPACQEMYDLVTWRGGSTPTEPHRGCATNSIPSYEIRRSLWLDGSLCITYGVAKGLSARATGLRLRRAQSGSRLCW